MACTVDLAVNDIPGTFPLDLTSINISNITPGLTVVNNFDGTVDVSSLAVGTYTFDYTIDDTNGNTSNTVTVTITITPPPTPSPPTPTGINVNGNNSSPGNIPFPAGITPGCYLFMVTGDQGTHTVSSEWTQIDTLANAGTSSQLFYRLVDGTETTWSFLTGTDVNWSIVEFCDVDTFILDTVNYIAEPYTLNQPTVAPNDRPWIALLASGNDGGSSASGFTRKGLASDFRRVGSIATSPPGSTFAYRTMDQGETITSSLANGVDDLTPVSSGGFSNILDRVLVLYGSVLGNDPDLDVSVQTSVPNYVGSDGWNNGNVGSALSIVAGPPNQGAAGSTPNPLSYQPGDFVIGVNASGSVGAVKTPNGFAPGPQPDALAGYKSWYGFPEDPSFDYESLYPGSQAGILRAYRGVNVKRPVSDLQVLLGAGTTVNFPSVEAVAGDIIVLLVAANNTNGSLTISSPAGSTNLMAVNQWPGRAYAFDFIAPFTGTIAIPSFVMNQSASSYEAYAIVLKGA